MRPALASIIPAILLALCTSAEDAQIERKIKRAIEQKVVQTVTEEKVARLLRSSQKLEIVYPPTPVTMPPEQVMERVDAEIQRIAASQTKTEDAYRAEILDRLPFCEIGTEVHLFGLRGETFTGVLHEVKPGAVRVGSRKISRRDLTPDSLLRLDRERHAAYVDRSVRNKLEIEAGRLDSLRAVEGKQIEKRLYQEAGYVYFNRRWREPVKLLSQAVAYHRNKYRTKIRAKTEAAIYQEHGYTQDEYGTWVYEAAELAAGEDDDFAIEAESEDGVERQQPEQQSQPDDPAAEDLQSPENVS